MVSHRRRNRIALVLALLALLGLVAVAVAVAWPGADGGRGKAARAAVRPLPPASKDCDRRIQSRAFVVADARGRTLAALRPRVRRPVGSLVKLMTAGVVLNAGALDRQVSVPELRLQPDESRAGLDTGDRMTRRSLLRALLVPSGNDAAETLAITSPAGRTSVRPGHEPGGPSSGPERHPLRQPLGDAGARAALHRRRQRPPRRAPDGRQPLPPGGFPALDRDGRHGRCARATGSWAGPPAWMASRPARSTATGAWWPRRGAGVGGSTPPCWAPPVPRLATATPTAC